MFKSIDSFLTGTLKPVFSERPNELSPWFFEYFSELATPGGPARYARALKADLDLAGFRPEGRILVDAGSGFGVTLLCLATLRPAMALGIESFRPMAISSEILRQRYAAGLPAGFVLGSVHQAPLPNASVDFVYCNEAFSHFRNPPAFMNEAGRILRRGGILMICDGNNGKNPVTVGRVRHIWRRFEEGPPGDDIHGHRVEVPYRDRRRAMIASGIPGLEDDVLDRLAWGTFRRHGRDVIDEARRLLQSGRLPDAPPPVDASPVDPVKGDYIENLLHPDDIRRDLERMGFSVRVHAHFAGARGPVYAAVNSVLRRLTPLTIGLARSVKIVATRR